MKKLSVKNIFFSADCSVYLPNWVLKIFPLIGLFLGFFIWILDAFIDTYFLKDNNNFLKEIVLPESSELWMRSLIVAAMTALSFYAKRIYMYQIQVEQHLRQQQAELENVIETRTSELKRLANLDPLTHIYNRRKFSEVLAHEIERCSRYGQPLSVILCDIDFFKKVNDKYGHDAGDQVLIEFAEFLKNNLRTSDYYARWGGEEFIILLTHSDLNKAAAVGEKLRKEICNYEFSNDLKITASMGVASYKNDEEMNLFIKRADDALYTAKASGRNKVIYI